MLVHNRNVIGKLQSKLYGSATNIHVAIEVNGKQYVAIAIILVIVNRVTLTIRKKCRKVNGNIYMYGGYFYKVLLLFLIHLWHKHKCICDFFCIKYDLDFYIYFYTW